MQMALHRGDRHHPLVRRAQLVLCLLRRHGARFQKQDAGDDLQAVGDAVPHLAQQGPLLLKQFLGMLRELLFLLFDDAAIRNVLDRQQDHPAGGAFVADWQCVELEGSSAEVREVLLELEALDCCMLGDDGGQQAAEPRNVPLPVRKLEQRPPMGLHRIFVEKLVKAAASGKQMERVIKHEERFRQRVDDRKREGLRFSQIVKLFHRAAPAGGSIAHLSATGAPGDDR